MHASSLPLPAEAQDEIALLLAHQHLRDMVGWGTVVGLAMLNLAWSGAASLGEEQASLHPFKTVYAPLNYSGNPGVE